MKHHLSINIFAFVALPLAMFLSCQKDKKQTERTIANGKVYGHKNIACKISSWGWLKAPYGLHASYI